MKGSSLNLIDVLSQADKIDFESGLTAYEKYHRQMMALSFKYGSTIEQTTAVFVSTSPNNEYKQNLRSTVSVLDGWKRGLPEEMIRISTYNHCRKRALEYLNGKDFLDSTKGPKIKSFFRNIVNPLDKEPVTVDGHMVGAWFGKRLLMKEAIMTKFAYDEIADAVRTIATSCRLIPNQVQAILWFTWKRINNSVYNDNLNLFGDHWGLDIDPTKIKPYEVK